MNGAEIFVSAGLAESERKLFVGIQHFGFERFVGADGGMRNIVAICPGDGRSHRHLQLRRSETEIVDLYLRHIGLLLRGGRQTSCPSAQTRKCHSECRRKQDCSRHNSPHVFSLSFIWLLLWNFFVAILKLAENPLPPTHAGRARNSHRLFRARFSIALQVLSSARVTAPCQVPAAETRSTRQCGMLRCLPPFAWSGGCGHSEQLRIQTSSDTRAPARCLPFPNPIPDKWTTAECARTPRSVCCSSDA